MTPIEIRQLEKTYRGKRGRRIHALRGVDLEVSEGEVFGFLGPNGAGKSTLIKTLVGQIAPTVGTASLFGEPTGAPEARQRIGYLPENPAFYDYLTAWEYLVLVGETFGIPSERIKDAAAEALETMGLTEAARRSIRGYSKGMVQRLGLAQTLMHDPDLYILDEPMSGLDPVGRSLVKQTMLDLKARGKTVFFSTHVIADVEEVCDRVAIIAQGQLQAIRQVSEVVQSGITGYSVQIGLKPEGSLDGYDLSPLGNGRWALDVSSQDFQAFLERLFAAGGEIEFVEPRRKSLESLFLDIVQESS